MISKTESISRLNLILRTIRNVHRLLIKEKNLDRLLKGICQNLIQNRGYYNAWIATLDNNMDLDKYAQCGLDKEFAPLGANSLIG